MVPTYAMSITIVIAGGILWECLCVAGGGLGLMPSLSLNARARAHIYTDMRGPDNPYGKIIFLVHSRTREVSISASAHTQTLPYCLSSSSL